MTDTALVAPLIDAVIVLTLIEGAALLAYHARSGRGVAPREFAANLIAGLALMLALGGLAHRVAPLWIALALLGAGIAHGVDMARRWQRRTETAR